MYIHVEVFKFIITINFTDTHYYIEKKFFVTISDYLKIIY